MVWTSLVLLTVVASAACKDSEETPPRPMVVSEAHGTVEMTLLVSGVPVARQEEALKTFAARFKDVGQWGGIHKTIVSPRGNNITLQLQARVGPDCGRREVAGRIEELLALATTPGDFGVHVLPPPTRVNQALPAIRMRAGPGVEVGQQRGMPGVVVLFGPEADLRRAREQLRGWEPLAGYRLVVGAIERSELKVYLVRHRPDMDRSAVESVTIFAADGLFTIHFTADGKQRLETLTDRARGSVLVTRIDDALLEAVRVRTTNTTGRMMVRPAVTPERVRSLAAYVNTGALPTGAPLQVVSKKSACKTRSGTVAP